MKSVDTLFWLKLSHTIIWAFFVGCILAIPITAQLGQFHLTLIFIVCVCVEVAVLLLNRWKCPLSNVAENLTEERQENFDIFLPIWIARNNKQIFGSLFVLGLIYAALKWQGWLR